MGLTNREKQKAHRERMAAQGIVPICLEIPKDLALSIAVEAKACGKTRNKVAVERLSARKPQPTTVPLPKDITKEANRIVKLIGKGLRASTDPVALQALNDALDSIYGLAGMVAVCQTSTKKKRRRQA